MNVTMLLFAVTAYPVENDLEIGDIKLLRTYLDQKKNTTAPELILLRAKKFSKRCVIKNKEFLLHLIVKPFSFCLSLHDLEKKIFFFFKKKKVTIKINKNFLFSIPRPFKLSTELHL